MATAPLVVFLYDRTFVAGSFAGAWRRRPGPPPCARLVLASDGGVRVAWGRAKRHRRVSARASPGGPTRSRSSGRWRSTCGSSLWPHPLIGDYGRFLGGAAWRSRRARSSSSRLAAGTVILLRRNRPAGFLGAWFLLILAPSSSVIPVSTEIIAEHRMYLPLAAIATLFAAALYVGGRAAAPFPCACVRPGARPRRRDGLEDAGLPGRRRRSGATTS